MLKYVQICHITPYWSYWKDSLASSQIPEQSHRPWPWNNSANQYIEKNPWPDFIVKVLVHYIWPIGFGGSNIQSILLTNKVKIDTYLFVGWVTRFSFEIQEQSLIKVSNNLLQKFFNSSSSRLHSCGAYNICPIGFRLLICKRGTHICVT